MFRIQAKRKSERNVKLPRKTKKKFKKMLTESQKQLEMTCFFRGHELRIVQEINAKEKICVCCAKMESEIH